MRQGPDRSVRSLALGATRATLLAVAAAWALWLVAAQALLWTPLLRHLLNSHSPTIHLEYQRAWSVWPGVVHARGLVLTGQDRSVQWRLALDEVRTSIAVGQLPARVFHAEHVRVRGVQFALRRRQFVQGRVPASGLRGLPLIPGFAAEPLKEEGPDDILPDQRYRLFTVWLEDVRGSDVRQVWVDRWNVEGAKEVAGGFYLKPIRDVLVAPGALVLDGARVSGFGVPVASALQGTVRMALGHFDPRGITRERLLRTLHVDADVRARLSGIEAFGGSGGAGPVEVSARVRAGRLEQGTLRADLEELSRSGLQAQGAKLRAQAGAGWEGRLDVSEARLRGTSARAQSVQVRASGDAIDLASPSPPRSVAVDLQGGRIGDMRLFARRLFDTHRVSGGRGAFSAHLEGPADRLRGRATLSLSGLQVWAKGVQVRGNARIDARVNALDPLQGADLSGTRVSVDGGRLVPDQEIGPGWWGRAVLPRARVRFEQPRVDADLVARCRDARPIVGVYAHLADLPGFLNSLFGMDGLSVRGSAHAGRGWLSVPDVKAEGDGASIQATLRQDGDAQRGAALLTVRGISIALDLHQGGSDLHIFGPGDFFSDRQREVKAAPLGRRAPPPRR